MTMTMTAAGPAPGVLSPPGCRVRRHLCRYKWVRRTKDKYQARPWIEPEVGGPINLGLYATEEAARQAIQAWVAAGARPDAGLPPGVLPKWVFARSDGTFGAVAQFAGREIRVRGRATPGEAFRAAAAKVDRIRKEDGWLDAPLPSGVVVRSNGYAIRVWHNDRVFVLAGPFARPEEARAAIPGQVRLVPAVV